MSAVSEHKMSPEMQRLIFDHLNASLSYHSSMDTEWSMTKGVFLMQEAEEKLFTAISSLESQLAEARRDTERLEGIVDAYADHQIGCKARQSVRNECSCGLDKALESAYANFAADSARGAPHER